MIILKKVYNYFKILALDITIYLLSILFALMYDSSDIIFIILYVYATIFISVCVYRLDNGFLV